MRDASLDCSQGPPLSLPPAPPSGSSQGFQCLKFKKILRTPQGLKSHITRLHPFDYPVVPPHPGADPQPGSSFTRDSNDIHTSTPTIPLASVLGGLRSSCRIVRRIPKGARVLAATALADTIDLCLREGSIHSWERLLLFASQCLVVPEKRADIRCSLTSSMKDNITRFQLGQPIPRTLPARPLSRPTSYYSTMSASSSSVRPASIQAKLSDGDVRGVVRLLSSTDTYAPDDSNTLNELRKKHPSSEPYTPMPPACSTSISAPFQVSESEVLKAISSFPVGSSGGLDMLRPQHLKDMTGHSVGVAGGRLLSSLTKLCNLMLTGGVPEEICPALYGASLCALQKKTGDIRPIAVGSTLRRLTAKLASTFFSSKLGTSFQPIQLGFGSRGGVEAASHAARRYVSFDHHDTKVLLKVDFKNAFNSIHRGHMLQCVQSHIPELYPFVDQCYRHPSHLVFNDTIIPSARGVQQGDPLGPALFCLVLQPLASSMQSEFNSWYLDDGAIADTPSTVIQDFETLRNKSTEVGLELNTSKCELYVLSKHQDISAVSSLFAEVAPDIQIIPKHSWSLLGSPLSPTAMGGILSEKTSTLRRMADRLSELSTHCAFYILKHSQAIPKLTHVLRCSPTWECMANLVDFDNTLRGSLVSILNVSLSDDAWEQSSWPVEKGGLGVRHAQDLALPAFLSSCTSSSQLVDAILPAYVRNTTDTALSTGMDLWTTASGSPLPLEGLRGSQREWELPVLTRSVQNAMDRAPSSLFKARLHGVSSSESGAFLQVLPSAPLGTLMDDDTFRTSVALRLGANVCQPHICPCGTPVSSLGTHGLSCRLNQGRQFRHSAVNDLIRRAMVTAGIPAALEPTNLAVDASLRPDGITLVPWSHGKSLTWDFTCTDGMAPSHVESSAGLPLYAASLSERNKKNKYAQLTPHHIFTPIAVECLGSFGPESLTFLKNLGRRITTYTGEPRSSEFLLQRLSVAIQTGNARAIRGTMPAGASLEEYFELL